ncbi:MAG: UDP-N-acetylglucosamine 2-epimerase (non-hydrolyzing) [Verrucomicrobiota bacterium]
MKLLTVVGARPQFIKAAVMSEALRSRGHQEILVHTGQHYDAKMSDVFFTELGIPEPDVNLSVGSGTHGETTGEMMAGIEKVCTEGKPERMLVYGDTNSTLAGALVAAKLHIPVIHIEAGLRSFDKRMPEEVNRVLTDHVSDLLFCPTEVAVGNLQKEGITEGVHQVGDIMLDSLLRVIPLAEEKSTAMADFNLERKAYTLVTMHRPSNTDDPKVLRSLLESLNDLGDVLFPMHPRCAQIIEREGLKEVIGTNVQIVEPLGYLDLVTVLKNARLAVTDSGGLQKEAYWLFVPCITLREQTEWVETVKSGWNQLAGNSAANFQQAVSNVSRPELHPDYYGDGKAAEKICRWIEA